VKLLKYLLVGSICVAGLFGCATFKTLDTNLPLEERLFIYSGTRLDWAALAKNDAALRKYKIPPPRYPLVDLPFSFALDSMFLPIATYAEIFH
jgi:uncharacterized protein YceK